MKTFSMIGLLAPCLLASGCLPDLTGDCGTTVLSRVPNPENGHNNFHGPIAEVIQQNCGATVALITSVRLMNSDNKPLAGDGTVFANYHGSPEISVQWKDKDTLLISCPDCKDQNITLKTVKFNFTNIQYSN
ncbi:MAG: hypothetical protein JSS87_07395 [Acidobacteria bacterium]|nr:hypothetical protein [Acidobacteriota bacterium]